MSGLLALGSRVRFRDTYTVEDGKNVKKGSLATVVVRDDEGDQEGSILLPYPLGVVLDSDVEGGLFVKVSPTVYLTNTNEVEEVL